MYSHIELTYFLLIMKLNLLVLVLKLRLF